MDDRAVVDASDVYPEEYQDEVRRMNMESAPIAPRALVALSEDRQWLVVLRDGYWTMYQHAGYVDDYQMWADFSDTGQSADAVLADWLEGRREG